MRCAANAATHSLREVNKAEKMLRNSHDSFTLACAEIGCGRLVFEQHFRASLNRRKAAI